jgi:hypothetical protein
MYLTKKLFACVLGLAVVALGTSTVGAKASETSSLERKAQLNPNYVGKDVTLYMVGGKMWGGRCESQDSDSITVNIGGSHYTFEFAHIDFIVVK